MLKLNEIQTEKFCNMEVYNPCNVKVTWNGITLEDGFDQVVTVTRTKHLPVGVNDIECEITFTEESIPILKELLQKEWG